MRYSYPGNAASMVDIKDGDDANRVATPGDHTVAPDGMVAPFEDMHYVLP